MRITLHRKFILSAATAPHKKNDKYIGKRSNNKGYQLNLYGFYGAEVSQTIRGGVITLKLSLWTFICYFVK